MSHFIFQCGQLLTSNSDVWRDEWIIRGTKKSTPFLVLRFSSLPPIKSSPTKARGIIVNSPCVAVSHHEQTYETWTNQHGNCSRKTKRASFDIFRRWRVSCDLAINENIKVDCRNGWWWGWWKSSRNGMHSSSQREECWSQSDNWILQSLWSRSDAEYDQGNSMNPSEMEPDSHPNCFVSSLYKTRIFQDSYNLGTFILLIAFPMIKFFSWPWPQIICISNHCWIYVLQRLQAV